MSALVTAENRRLNLEDSSMSSQNKDGPSVKQLFDVIEQLKREKCEFFVDSQNRPTICLPDDGFQQDWSVDSQRVNDHLMNLYLYHTHRILSGSDLGMLKSLLREECRKGGRRKSQVEDASLGQDPIIQGLIYLMNGEPVWCDRTAELQRKLIDLQNSPKISGLPAITPVTNFFVRKLKGLIPALRGLGIDVEITHKEDGSFTTVKRLTSFKREPNSKVVMDDGDPQASSVSSSAVTARSCNAYRQYDDTDAARFYETKSAREKSSEEETAVNQELQVEKKGDES